MHKPFTPLFKSILVWLLAAALFGGSGVLFARGFWFSAEPSAHANLQDVPNEARETLKLIQNGGPFPYQRDGIEFQNREQRLPKQPRAYYREYTVPTPGAHDRGARRIISGEANEYYYSDDHYRSFKRIQP